MEEKQRAARRDRAKDEEEWSTRRVFELKHNHPRFFTGLVLHFVYSLFSHVLNILDLFSFF